MNLFQLSLGNYPINESNEKDLSKFMKDNSIVRGVKKEIKIPVSPGVFLHLTVLFNKTMSTFSILKKMFYIYKNGKASFTDDFSQLQMIIDQLSQD